MKNLKKTYLSLKLMIKKLLITFLQFVMKLFHAINIITEIMLINIISFNLD